MPIIHRFRAAGILALVALSAVVLAACGSSGSSNSTAQASATGTLTRSVAGSGQRSKLRACLQQHGVTLPQRRNGAGGGYGGPPPGSGNGGPPPGGGYGGGGFFRGGGLAQRNPKLAAALKACGASFGGGRQRFRLQRANITKYVTCVRQHGYNLPSPNFSGNGPVFPASIRTNKKFLAASKSCQSLLAPPRPGASSSATATSTKTA